MVRNESGFTLIELMIVTAIVGVIAGVAVPNLVSSRATANERAIVATLRTIATAQAQCSSQQVVDLDHDGCGEALGLGEMAGATDLRGGAVRLAPPGLAQSLGTLDAGGFATAKGYLPPTVAPG
jgi:type IV pilus assembly protein PilA